MLKRGNPLPVIREQIEEYLTARELARWMNHLAAILTMIFAILTLRQLYLQSPRPNLGTSSQSAQAVQTSVFLPTPIPPTPSSLNNSLPQVGIQRLSILHTDMPTRPRQDVISYTVKPGDNLFSIADKFAIRPSTILWGNALTLKDDPHLLQLGQVLNILPADGAYYEWHTGEGLDAIAASYHVVPNTIMKWIGNHINPSEINDVSNPNLKQGTKLFIPGGLRPFTTQRVPYILRSNTKDGNLLGSSICPPVKGGPTGSGFLIWPTNTHHLAGYRYAPEENHHGIDIAGKMGDPVVAVDHGVVVYAGNSARYGNAVVIEHGDGWQSFYAYLNSIGVGCGQYIAQGTILGALGGAPDVTAPNLHFEYMSDKGTVDPMNFLPK